MNTLEKERLNIANNLVENCRAKAYKASFEDEGASLEDISRAKIVTESAGLDLNIKIGGCEAIADIKQCKILGTKAIVGPMIESSYAMQKFISAIKGVYDEEEIRNLTLGINIETITGAENIKKILSIKEVEKYIKRITLGRVDFVGSLGLSKEEINSDKVYKYTEKVLSIAKEHNIKTAIGGGIDTNSIGFIQKLGNLLDYYETRYIIFKNKGEISEKEMAIGIKNAQSFELNYLQDMSNRHQDWVSKNMNRCEMIKSRINISNEYINRLK